MYTIIVIILILCFLFLFLSCHKSFRLENGHVYKADKLEHARLLNVLADISKDLPKHVNKKYSKKLQIKTQNTSFTEIIGGDKSIVGWNYNKGREIGIRLIGRDNKPYSALFILDTFLHELAHSITDDYGHGKEWREINDYLQTYKSRYVSFLINKTFLTR